MRRRIATWAASLIASSVTVTALAADRYDLLFTEASYSSPDQSTLRYASFVGDRRTGAIYSCSGKIILNPRTGDFVSHEGSCDNAYTPPSGSSGEFGFSRMGALDPTSKAATPKMNPAWGFWRIDQLKHLHAFCTRYGYKKVVWACFESMLPG